MSDKAGRSWPLREKDIRYSAERIASTIAGLSYDAFIDDRDAIDVVLFNLIVIGEAASQAPPDIVASLTGVPWNKIKGMRNAIAHGYFALDLEVVWSTASWHVPDLIAELDRV